MTLPPSTTEQYAREHPARFARAMGNDYLADVLEGRRPPMILAERIFGKGNRMGDEPENGNENGDENEGTEKVEVEREMVEVEETKTVEQPASSDD